MPTTHSISDEFWKINKFFNFIFVYVSRIHLIRVRFSEGKREENVKMHVKLLNLYDSKANDAKHLIIVTSLIHCYVNE